jgi:hypothetical protein
MGRIQGCREEGVPTHTSPCYLSVVKGKGEAVSVLR